RPCSCRPDARFPGLRSRQEPCVGARMSQAAVDLLLRGYRAFVAGDLAAIEGMLDPEVEWIGVGEGAAIAQRDDVLEILRDRLSEEYSVTVGRCIGVGDDVVVSMRF